MAGVVAAGARSLTPAARPLRTLSAAPPASEQDVTTSSANVTATTATTSVSTTAPPGRTAPQTTAVPSTLRPTSSTTWTTTPHSLPAACTKPPGAGSGPYVDADVVDMPNAPAAGGDTNYDYGEPAPVAQWINDHPDVSIGPYVSGNHIYVGFSKDAESNLAALRHDTGEGSNVRGYRVKYSGAEVNAVYEAIWSDRDWLAAQGIHLNGDGGDPTTDTAFAMVTTADEHACDVFLQRYGSGRFYLIEEQMHAD